MLLCLAGRRVSMGSKSALLLSGGVVLVPVSCWGGVGPCWDGDRNACPSLQPQLSPITLPPVAYSALPCVDLGHERG